VACCSNGQLQIEVWNVDSLESTYSSCWPGGSGRARAVAFNGSSLAVVAADRSLLLAHVAAGKRPERIQTSFELSCCSWSSAGLLWAGGHHSVVMWPSAKDSAWTQVGEMVVGRCKGAVRAVCAVPNVAGGGVVSGCDQGSLQLWHQPAAGALKDTCTVARAHQGCAITALDARATLVVSAGLDRMLRVWSCSASGLSRCSEFGIGSMGCAAAQLLDSVGRPLVSLSGVPVSMSLTEDAEQVAIVTSSQEVLQVRACDLNDCWTLTVLDAGGLEFERDETYHCSNQQLSHTANIARML